MFALFVDSYQGTPSLIRVLGGFGGTRSTSVAPRTSVILVYASRETYGWLWCLPPHTNAERARLPAPAKERRWSDARRPLAEACPPPRWAALLLRVSAGGP